MHEDLWRVMRRSGYRLGMGSRHRATEPERRLPELDQWEGYWVAVKDGKVIAAAHNSRDLVPQLHEMGERGKGAVAQYVMPRSETITIGVG